MGRFNFEGNIIVRDGEFFKTNKTKTDKDTASIKFGVSAGTSIVSVELFGMKDQIYTQTVDGELLVIDWEDRDKKELLDKIPYYKKHIINIPSKECHEEFISSYDMVLKLNELLKDGFKGSLICTGDVSRDPYVNKDGVQMYITKFNLRNVYESRTDKKVVPHLKYDEVIYFNSDSVDMSDYETDKRIYLNGYVKQWIRKVVAEKYFGGIDEEKGKTFYIPETFVLDMSKLDQTNELQKKCGEYVMSNITKVKDNTNMYAMSWNCSYVNGAEEIDFDESQLTDNQKLEIELGLSTLDDFKPRGTIYGSRVRETRLVKPNTRGNYADGPVEIPETMDEFEDSVAVFIEQESLDEVVNSAAKEPKEEEKKEASSTEDFDSMLENIFG